MPDLVAELDRTSRTVADAELRGTPAHAVELRRRIDVPPSEAWRACTDPERIRCWFLPVTGNLHAGGRFQLEGHAGGDILVCEPPRRLELTWRFGDAEPSRVSIELTSAGPGATDLMMRHTVAQDDHWEQFGPGAVGVGWDLTVLALARLLAGGDTIDASEFGPAVMRASAASWGSAHDASGVGTEVAQDAAARTSAFYAPPEQSTD